MYLYALQQTYLLDPDFFGGALLVLGIVLVWGWLSRRNQPHPADHILRWDGLVKGLEDAPYDFYERFGERLKAKLKRPDLPFDKLRITSCQLLATRTFGGSFGHRPIYFKATYGPLSYYVFASRAPDGLYLTSWAFTRYTEWLKRPWMHGLLLWRLRRETLFEHDIAVLFADLMHRTLIEVADSCCEERGLHPLDVAERRPVMQEFYAPSSHLWSGPSVSLQPGASGQSGNSLMGGSGRAYLSGPSSILDSPVLAPPTVVDDIEPRTAVPVQGTAPSGTAPSGTAPSGTAPSGTARPAEPAAAPLKADPFYHMP